MAILSLIAAVAKNRIIGHQNTLPWHLPEDLAFFKRTTLGHAIVMGRRTYESIGKPLPGRTNIVVTSQTHWAQSTLHKLENPTNLPQNTHLIIAHSLEEALENAAGHKEIFIVGGARIYAQALKNLAIDRIVLTELDTNFTGDAYFPELPSKFVEHSRTNHPATDQRPWGFAMVEYLNKEKNETHR